MRGFRDHERHEEAVTQEPYYACLIGYSIIALPQIALLLFSGRLKLGRFQSYFPPSIIQAYTYRYHSPL